MRRNSQEKKSSDIHAIALRLAIVVLMSVITARLFFLQVLESERYMTISEKNRLRTHTLLAPRGLIMDRRGEVLAENRPSYSLYVYERDLDDAMALLDTLALFIPFDVDETALHLNREMTEGKRGFKPVRLFRDMRFSDVCVVEENRSRLPGIEIEAEPVRYYRYPYVSEHAVGHMGEISPDEWPELKNMGYAYRSLKGVSGIEKAYEEYLRGRNGISFVEVNARGHRIGDFEGRETVDPVPGHSVMLNLDIRLQSLALELMDERPGAVAAIDPQTGDILTLVSSPSYDGNLFSGGGISTDDWKALSTDPEKPLFNRAISSRYPPGSVYKIVTSLLALETGLADGSTTFTPCVGGYRFGSRIFKCWKLSGHGVVDFFDAFKVSCDVYFYNIGLRFDLDKFADFSEKIGMGKRTGIELEGESEGFIPDIDWYDRTYGKGKWTKGLFLNLAIGQGEILVTPLQIAMLYGSIAGDGILMAPRITKKITNPNFRSEFETTKPRPLKLDIDDKHIAMMKECMRRVVEDENGTGKKTAVEHVSVGGKTGTAQNSSGNEHAWFVGVAPLENPRISVAVIVENAGHGGEVAAPIAGRIIGYYLNETAENI